MIFNVVCQAVGTEDPQSQQCEGKMLTRSRSSRLELLESPSNASRSYPDLPHRSQRLQSLAELLRFERPRSHPRSTLGHVEIDSRCRGEQRDTAKRETTRVCPSICLSVCPRHSSSHPAHRAIHSSTSPFESPFNQPNRSYHTRSASPGPAIMHKTKRSAARIAQTG
jgi:hypothetical protein